MSKTAREVFMEHQDNVEKLKAVYLYKLFGDCVTETQNGFTIKTAILLRKLSEIIY